MLVRALSSAGGRSLGYVDFTKGKVLYKLANGGKIFTAEKGKTYAAVTFATAVYNAANVGDEIAWYMDNGDTPANALRILFTLDENTVLHSITYASAYFSVTNSGTSVTFNNAAGSGNMILLELKC